MNKGSANHSSNKNKSSADGNGKRKKANLPRRPLSAYNLYFRQERELLKQEMREGGVIPEDFMRDLKVAMKRLPGKRSSAEFQAMASTIANRWKELSQEKKEPYEKQADKEMKLYMERKFHHNVQLLRERQVDAKSRPSPEGVPELEDGKSKGGSVAYPANVYELAAVKGVLQANASSVDPLSGKTPAMDAERLAVWAAPASPSRAPADLEARLRSTNAATNPAFALELPPTSPMGSLIEAQRAILARNQLHRSGGSNAVPFTRWLAHERQIQHDQASTLYAYRAKAAQAQAQLVALEREQELAHLARLHHARAEEFQRLHVAVTQRQLLGGMNADLVPLVAGSSTTNDAIIAALMRDGRAQI